MANPSKFIDLVDKLKRWMGRCYWMGASSESKNATPLSFENKHTITPSIARFPSMCTKGLNNEKKAKSEENMSVEDEIEQSKVHWSQLIQYDIDNKEVAEENNVEVFKSLQRHPRWGRFFRTFGDGGIYDYGELVMGGKFAEGGQAELYHAHVTWKNPKINSRDQTRGFKWVLKVFRKGTFLQDLQKQWPEGLFRQYEEAVKLTKSGKSQPTKYTCDIQCGTLLPDGRFAFLIVRETEDLRTSINHKMKAKTSLDCGPFPMREAIQIMYIIAKGMDQLHNLDIVHRDLKASNVLCAHFNKNSNKKICSYYIADFECSIGVVGTGFFRAPEILQVVKDKVLNERPNVFTKASDIYSYGMVCYEILTGKLPFEGHPIHNFDLVLSGQQPEVPLYIDEWVRDLLQRCWQFDHVVRPTFGEILKLLEENSKDCKRMKQQIEEWEMLPNEIQIDMYIKYEFES